MMKIVVILLKISLLFSGFSDIMQIQTIQPGIEIMENGKLKMENGGANPADLVLLEQKQLSNLQDIGEYAVHSRKVSAFTIHFPFSIFHYPFSI